jgi:hypothetical protein
MNQPRHVKSGVFIAACLAGWIAAEAVPAASAPPTRDVLGAILQADGPRASVLLKTLPGSSLKTCMFSRLKRASPETSVGDAFTRRTLEAYEEYWRRAAMHPSARRAEETKLLQRLQTLLGDRQLRDISSAEPVIAARIKQAGYHSLQGTTGVLRDLMIWSHQTERQEQIDLPEGPQLTRVFLLDGFVSRGWSTYLTCGETGTGGWTRPEGLYAVVPAYASLDDERFRVNFVAHESQHFSDNARFPDLKDWEKEYRAKLTELALADTTRSKTLEYFNASQGDDPADAHSYANRRVIEAIRVRLGLVPDDDLMSVNPALLRQTAVEELKADSARRAQATPSSS